MRKRFVALGAGALVLGLFTAALLWRATPEYRPKRARPDDPIGLLVPAPTIGQDSSDREGIEGFLEHTSVSRELNSPLAPEYVRLWDRYPNSRILPPRTVAEHLEREAQAKELSYVHEMIRRGVANPEDIRRFHDERIARLKEARAMLQDTLKAREALLFPEERAGILSLLRAQEMRIAEYKARRARALKENP